MPDFSGASTPLPLVSCGRTDGLRAGRTWRPEVCCRYQQQSAQPAEQSGAELVQLSSKPGCPPSEEPLAWMHHGHVCLQGSVFR